MYTYIYIIIFFDAGRLSWSIFAATGEGGKEQGKSGDRKRETNRDELPRISTISRNKYVHD